MNESIDEWSRWMHAWRMLRRKDETIHGAQRLHTVLVARAAQEFPETRASAHPRLMLPRREKKRLVHHRHHHQAGRQLYAWCKPKKRGHNFLLSPALRFKRLLLSSCQVLSSSSLLFQNILLLMTVCGPRGGSRRIGACFVGHDPAQSFQKPSGRGSDFPWAVLGQRPLFHYN